MVSFSGSGMFSEVARAYNSADSLLCQCYNSNVLLMRIERRTMANIQVRVDDALRDEAVAVLNRLGMDMATAVRLLLNQIVVDNGYPFKPTSDPFYSSSNIRHLEKVLDDVKEALQKPLLPSRMEQKCSVQFFLTTPGGAVFFTNIIVKYYYDNIRNLVVLWKSCSMAN